MKIWNWNLLELLTQSPHCQPLHQFPQWLYHRKQEWKGCQEELEAEEKAERPPTYKPATLLGHWTDFNLVSFFVCLLFVNIYKPHEVSRTTSNQISTFIAANYCESNCVLGLSRRVSELHCTISQRFKNGELNIMRTCFVSLSLLAYFVSIISLILITLQVAPVSTWKRTSSPLWYT